VLSIKADFKLHAKKMLIAVHYCIFALIHGTLISINYSRKEFNDLTKDLMMSLSASNKQVLTAMT